MEALARLEALRQEVRGRQHQPEPGNSIGRLLMSGVVMLVVVFLVGRVIASAGDSGPDGSILRASGCIPLNVQAANSEPSMPIEEAERAVRAHIAERGLLPEQGSGSDSVFRPGDVYWAGYGYLRRPVGPNTPDATSTTRNWVFVFEDERDDRWYGRFWRNPSGPRFTVAYIPEQDRITHYCGGYSSSS